MASAIFIHKQGSWSKLLRDAFNEPKRIKSAIKMCVEYIFFNIAISTVDEGERNVGGLVCEN